MFTERSPAAGSASLEAAPDDWEAPDADFEAHVGEVVRVRLGRHLLAPPGPARIWLPDAHALYAKVTGEILGKERQVGGGPHLRVSRRLRQQDMCICRRLASEKARPASKLPFEDSRIVDHLPRVARGHNI